jgi:hypothetical protein
MYKNGREKGGMRPLLADLGEEKKRSGRSRSDEVRYVKEKETSYEQKRVFKNERITNLKDYWIVLLIMLCKKSNLLVENEL